MSDPQQQHAPSAARRKRLKEREAVEGKNFAKVLDSFPIEKYYGMSDRLLTAFHQAVDERRLDDAYVFGLRFATFSLESLPKHKQYNHPHYKRFQAKNARAVEDVLQKMESVATRMDAEELRLARQRKEFRQREESARRKQKEAARLQEEQRLQEEEAKRLRHQQILQQQREELQAQHAAERIQKRKKDQQELERSAMEKLKLLNQQSNPQLAATQPQQQRDASNTTTDLVSASTGQPPHTKEAVAQQKAAEAEAARQKEEEDKREANQAPTFQATLQSKLKLFQSSKPKKSEAKAKPTAKTKPKEPSKLDPDALGQTNQLKEAFTKQDDAIKKPVSDYKADFAKFQAEWNNIKKDVGASSNKEVKTTPAFQQSAKSKLKILQSDSEKPSSKDPPASSRPATASKQSSAGEKDHEAPAFKDTAPKPKEDSSQQNLTDDVEPQKQQNPASEKKTAVKFPVPSKSKLKLFQMSPKKKSSKQVTTPAEPADEGFELKMTDAGPAVVDDFSYHDDAYRAKLTPSEAKTIKMLETAIQLQEKRLGVLESSNERSVLRMEAKKRLANGDKKGALHCLARKKRINQTIEVVKAAIFNMETQIIMLESAVEDREVNKIMKEASDQMSSFGNGVRVDDITDEKLGDVLASVGQGDMDYDEEELLSELQDGDEKVDLSVGDDDGLLSLPSVPQDEIDSIPNELPKKEDDAVKSILASLF